MTRFLCPLFRSKPSHHLSNLLFSVKKPKIRFSGGKVLFFLIGKPLDDCQLWHFHYRFSMTFVSIVQSTRFGSCAMQILSAKRYAKPQLPFLGSHSAKTTALGCSHPPSIKALATIVDGGAKTYENRQFESFRFLASGFLDVTAFEKSR
jgi:hypothetical protein